MKTNFNLLQTRIFCAVALGIGSSFGLAAATKNSAGTAPATAAIPWSQLGAKAGADYQGDALAVIPTAEGAHGIAVVAGGVSAESFVAAARPKDDPIPSATAHRIRV